MSEVKEKIEKTIEEVKETVKDVKETAKAVVDKTKKTVAKGTTKVIETTKAKSWWNRIWSAAVGAVLAVGAMFGITNDKIAEEKALVAQVKQYASGALTDIKNGDLKEATEKLEAANSIGQTVVKDAKETIDKIKNVDKEDVKNIVVESAKDGFKNPDTSTPSKDDKNLNKTE